VIFRTYRLPPVLKPVSGAFIIGVVVIALSWISSDARMLGLAGLGTGYGFVQLSLYTMVPLVVLVFLPFMKIFTTSVTLGSGGSGGVFAPGLTIGAATGGAIGMVFHILNPALVPLETVPVFVIVGMIALFGSIANAPIAVLIMVVEMMGNFSLLVPAMGGVGMAYLITGGRSIYREQVPTKAQSDAHRHEYGQRVLEKIFVREAMVPQDRVISLSPDDPVQAVHKLIEETAHTGYPVLDSGRLIGIVTIADVRRVLNGGAFQALVRDAMTRDLCVIAADDTLENAMRLMMINNIHHLPVIDPKNPAFPVGFLTRTDIMEKYSRNCRLI
jgi:CIC family chloride channel protein